MAPNILAVGGAPGQMIPYGYSSGVVTDSAWIAPYAKQGVNLTLVGESSTTVRLHSEVSTMYLKYHCAITILNGLHIYFCKGSTSSRLLGIGFASGLLTLYSCSNGGDSVLATGSTVIGRNQRIEVDVVVTIDDNIGTFSLYLNKGSSPEVTFSGDTLTNSLTTIDRLYFPPIDNPYHCVISGVIVADDDTRKLVYKEHSITGGGSLSEMTGTYEAINETGVNDTNFVTADTSGQRDTFTKSTLDSEFTGGGYNVVAQAVWTRAQTDPTSMTRGRLLLYDGTNLSESDSQILTEGYAPYQKVFSTPPDGGVWDFTKANNTQPGIKALS